MLTIRQYSGIVVQYSGPATIRLPTLVLITQAILLLKYGQTNKHTDRRD